MKVTIDSSVLAPALVGRRGSALELMDLWRANRFTLIVSEPIIQELIRAYRSQYFYDRGPRETDIGNLLLPIRTIATLAPLTRQVSGVATHPEDDLLLSTAVSGKADYLVTHDKQLLRLRVCQGVPIVRPGVVVGVIQQERP